jgi:type IV fimbrial biogenesis protein FimT
MGNTEPQHLLDGEEGTSVLNVPSRRSSAVSSAGNLPRRMQNGARGFTLIELIVTITLLGILVALSLPSFTAWIRNGQVRTVAEALQNGIRTAEAEAVRRNRQVTLTFTNSAPGLDVVGAAGGKNWSLQTVAGFGEAANEFITGGQISDVASGVTITASPAYSVICFNSNGRLVTNTGPGCTAAAMTFDVAQTNADRNLRVLVQVGGQLRMCDPKRAIATSPDGCP